jgi:eukaryotic-like serine/threonine-protein kinase
VSHFRITAALGAGGMGEVYRATDTSLGREVAVKLLPAEFADNPDRVARLQREARLLASLNHAHIAHLYGLETATVDGTTIHVLVMELVEGEDLAQRLLRGAIPIDEALPIARQIAEALEEAHDKGIVHRDLKPSNVKVTPDGTVKVLDFGLAKAWSGDSGLSSALSDSPTVADAGTAVGMLVGTAAYMSPEQARGKPVDRRTDIWAFGVVLHEMLTGVRLFAGETLTDVLAAVVSRPIALDPLPAGTPPTIRRLLARCLERNARQRLRDIGEARIALGDSQSGAETPPASLEATRSPRLGRVRERWVWAALAVLLAVLSAFVSRRFSLPAATSSSGQPRPPAQFILETPTGLSFPDLDSPAVSPDGRYVVFTGIAAKGQRALWIRPLDTPEARVLPGTEGAGNPFWSPDSSSIAFVARGEIRRLVLSAGTVQRICLLPRDRFTGGTWGEAGSIVFSTGGPSATLYQVPAGGGEAVPITTLDRTRAEAAHWWPQFLPSGRELLFQIGSGQPASAGLHLISLDAPSARRRVLADAARFEYAGGYLFAVQRGVLGARAFDPGRPETIGPIVTVAPGVATFANDSSWGWFSASASGRLVWISARDTTVQLQWMHRTGKPLGTIGEPGRYSQIALSPDDQRLSVEIPDATGRFDIWIVDVSRGLASRLTSDPANERDVVWSPDGQELVFSSDASGDQNLQRKRLLESGPPGSLPFESGATASEADVAESWSRAGNTLLYVTLGEERTIWTLDMSGHGRPETLVKGRFMIDEPHVSPDGLWLAYISTESGRYEVYLEPFRRRGQRVRVSTDGGGQPRWRSDGKELFYLSRDGDVMAVGVRDGPTGPEIGTPAMLQPPGTLRAIVQGADYDDYDVASDGQRFVMKVAAGQPQPQRLHIVTDWLSLFK